VHGDNTSQVNNVYAAAKVTKIINLMHLLEITDRHSHGIQWKPLFIPMIIIDDVLAWEHNCPAVSNILLLRKICSSPYSVHQLIKG